MCGRIQSEHTIEKIKMIAMGLFALFLLRGKLFQECTLLHREQRGRKLGLDSHAEPILRAT